MALLQKVARLSRREIRQDVRGRLMARLMDTDLALPVVDMSRGGFAVESPQPAVKGTVREMTFSTDENWCRLLTVRVTHCHALPPKLMRPGYRIGYQFVRPELAMATLTLVRVLGPKQDVDPWP